MDSNILKVFENNSNIDLIDIIISNSTNKMSVSKIKIRPVQIKGTLLFQCSYYKGKQIIHRNMEREEMLLQLPLWFTEGLTGKQLGLEEDIDNTVFRQIEFRTKDSQIHVLISKKGKATVKVKQSKGAVSERNLEHNRTKQYILKEGIPVPFLVDLGIMSSEGKIIRTKYDKYRQINRFLEYIEDVLPCFGTKKQLNIIDFGCGKSYLTFAMYYYLNILKGYEVQIAGLDLKDDVIRDCGQLSKKYGYTGLKFMHGDIAAYEEADNVDMVVTLHACDTATDYALYKAMKWGASAILSVPCCQHEVNEQIKSPLMEPILKYGLIKERTSALLTDAVRADILELCGYKAQILEFIDMEHTPKNILIRGIKDRTASLKEEKYLREAAKLKELMQFFGFEQTLYRLIKEDEDICELI